MQIEFREEISMRWWSDTDLVKKVTTDEEEQLEQEARDRVKDMVDQGYTSGELVGTLVRNNGRTEISMSGWWEIKKERK